MPFLFESETCSRCGGSGHYSYCQRFGTTCFRCSGKKETLTKRGQAAQLYYNRLLSLPVAQLQPGMKIRELGVTMGGDVYTQWVTVESITPDTCLYNGQLRENGLTIRATDKRGVVYNIGTTSDTLYRVSRTSAEKVPYADLAIAYQRSLNKSGKLDKTLAKIMTQVAWA